MATPSSSSPSGQLLVFMPLLLLVLSIVVREAAVVDADLCTEDSDSNLCSYAHIATCTSSPYARVLPWNPSGDSSQYCRYGSPGTLSIDTSKLEEVCGGVQDSFYELETLFFEDQESCTGYFADLVKGDQENKDLIATGNTEEAAEQEKGGVCDCNGLWKQMLTDVLGAATEELAEVDTLYLACSQIIGMAHTRGVSYSCRTAGPFAHICKKVGNLAKGPLKKQLSPQCVVGLRNFGKMTIGQDVSDLEDQMVAKVKGWVETIEEGVLTDLGETICGPAACTSTDAGCSYDPDSKTMMAKIIESVCKAISDAASAAMPIVGPLLGVLATSLLAGCVGLGLTLSLPVSLAKARPE